MIVEVVNLGKWCCFIFFILFKEVEEIKYMYLSCVIGFYIFLFV